MEYELITQHIIMSRHLNAHNNLFGGVVLAWLDEAGALFVGDKTKYSNFVTSSMDNVSFKNPGSLGDQVKICGKITGIGASTVELAVRASSLDYASGTRKDIIECKLVFVCLDDNGKPYPFFRRTDYGKMFRKDFLGQIPSPTDIA